MIEVIDELLLPDPTIQNTSNNITRACLKIREGLLIAWAQTHLSWDAAIEFAKAIKGTEPGEDYDYDALLIAASNKFPLDRKDPPGDAHRGPPPPPPPPPAPR